MSSETGCKMGTMELPSARQFSGLTQDIFPIREAAPLDSKKQGQASLVRFQGMWHIVYGLYEKSYSPKWKVCMGMGKEHRKVLKDEVSPRKPCDSFTVDVFILEDDITKVPQLAAGTKCKSQPSTRHAVC